MSSLSLLLPDYCRCEVADAARSAAGRPSQPFRAHRFYRYSAGHGAVWNSGCEHARFLRAAGDLRQHPRPLFRPRRHRGPVLRRCLYSREIRHHFFFSLRLGLCHADEPGGSARRTLPGLLSATTARARSVRRNSRAADLGWRHSADLFVIGSNFVALPQAPAEDTCSGGREVYSRCPS